METENPQQLLTLRRIEYWLAANTKESISTVASIIEEVVTKTFDAESDAPVKRCGLALATILDSYVGTK